MSLPSSFHIGPWLATPAANELVRGGDTVRVEPKMMEVLVVLAEHAGQTVTRDELLGRVWPDVVVTEDALSGAVSKLRRVLGDDARHPSYIETIPRTGYRLVAPVAPAEVAAPVHARSPELAAAPRPPRRLWLVTGLVLGAVLVWSLRSDREAEPELTIRPVTSAAGAERYPALDASGRRLAFAARARDSTYYHLFAQALDAESALQLTSARADDVWPAWSPDGETLAFLRCADLRCAVYTVPSLGGTPRRRAETTVSPYGLSWLSEGAVLVVDRDSTSAPYQLLRLDLVTGERRALTSPPAGALGDLAPAPGPDGTVAFVRHGTGGDEALYLLAPDATVPERVSDARGRIPGVAWESEEALVFTARREGIVGLWSVDARSGAISQAMAPGLRSPGMLTARAGLIVVESRTVEVNLWEVRPQDPAGPLRPLVVSSSADREPALSPGGDRLAFISDRSGTPELWVADRAGGRMLRITDLGGAGVGAPAWISRDQVVFEAQRGGQADIYVAHADGGTPRSLTDAAGYDVAPRPSRDGRWVYFGSDRSGRWEIWKTPAAGGEYVQVTADGGFVAQESPDGQTLYFTRYFEPGLWAMPAGGGEARLITEHVGALDWGNWAVTEAGLFWLDRRDDEARVLHTDLASGDVTTAFPAGAVPVREVGLTASRDGQTLVLARTERAESDLVLIEPRP